MPVGAPRGHTKAGGRVKGTPNKRTTQLRQALEAHGCDLAEQIAGVLQDPAVETSLKTDLLSKLLAYTYPQLRPQDPEGLLTPEQAAGMLGAQAVRFREALRRSGADEILVARVLDDLRTHTTNGAGASPPPV
jgi:hypothetical protein